MLARYQPQEVNGLTNEFNLGYCNRNCQQKCCQFCLDSAATVQYKLQWQWIKSGICPVEVICVSPVSLAAWCKFFGMVRCNVCKALPSGALFPRGRIWNPASAVIDLREARSLM